MGLTTAPKASCVTSPPVKAGPLSREELKAQAKALGISRRKLETQLGQVPRAPSKVKESIDNRSYHRKWQGSSK